MKSFSTNRLLALAIASGMGLAKVFPSDFFSSLSWPSPVDEGFKSSKKSSVAKQKREAKKRRNQWRHKISCRTRSMKR